MKYIPVQVLNPFRVDVAIKDDPVSLPAFTADIVDYLTQNVGEEAIVPFTCRRVECPI